MRQKGGLGLISLLVSALIIAVVTIYMLQGSFSNSQSKQGYASDIDQAKQVQIQADFKSIQTALEQYKVNNGSYPQSLDDLTKSSMLSGSHQNPYTHESYDYQSDGKNYTLSTKLGNGQDFMITN